MGKKKAGFSGESKEIYVSIDYGAYKQGKSDLLGSEIDLLNSLKHIQNFQQLREEKLKLRSRLNRSLMSANSELKRMESKIPSINEIPHITHNKPKQKHKSHSSQGKKNLSSFDKKRVEIESELRDIQKNLAKISSQ